jgi:uncharacterized protein (DUF736 family)
MPDSANVFVISPDTLFHRNLRAVFQKLISVKLDDPSLSAPIYATLSEVEGEDGYQLIWSHPNRD